MRWPPSMAVHVVPAGRPVSEKLTDWPVPAVMSGTGGPLELGATSSGISPADEAPSNAGVDPPPVARMTRRNATARADDSMVQSHVLCRGMCRPSDRVPHGRKGITSLSDGDYARQGRTPTSGYIVPDRASFRCARRFTSALVGAGLGEEIGRQESNSFRGRLQ